MDTLPLDPEAFEALTKLFLEGIRSGNYALVAGVALIVVMGLVRKYVKMPFLQTDAGGSLTLLTLAFLGAGVNALAAGAKLDGTLAMDAFKVALVAAGGFNLLKKLLPALIELVKKLAGAKPPAPSVPMPEPVKLVSLNALTLADPEAVKASMHAQGYVMLEDGRWKDRRLLKPEDKLAEGEA